MTPKNPFVLIGDIPNEYFCDRELETQRLISTISGGENLCLVSPRRMGKSKLIKHCYQQELLQEYYCFYIDILHTSSLRDFAFAFGKCVFETLQSKSERIASDFLRAVRSLTATLTFNPITGAPSFGLSLGESATAEYTFESIFQYLEKADKPCIVCFDEFQQISKYKEKNVEALLRSYIQNMSNAHFIFSGSERHMIYEMFSSKNRPFYKSTGYMELAPIAEDKYLDFAKNWFEKYDKLWDDEIGHFVYALSEGNTYTLQKIFHELFANLSSGEQMSREILGKVVDDIIESERPHYERILSHLPEHQQSLLFAIAKEGHVEKIMSGAFIRKHRLTSASSVQNAIKKLLEVDLVVLLDKQYYVDDIFFRMYLQKTGLTF